MAGPSSGAYYKFGPAIVGSTDRFTQQLNYNFGAATARVQRSVTGALTFQDNDQIVNVNLGAPASATVPLASTRAGVPLTIKLLPASAVLTINATAPDTFDGITPIDLQPGQSITLVPYNDGVNAGYSII